MTWKLPKDDGGSPILHYVVEKMDLSRGTWSDAGMSNTLNHDVTRLTHKKEYLFRVKAVNAIGESEPLEISRSVVIKNEFGGTNKMDFLMIFSICAHRLTNVNFFLDEPSQPGKPLVLDWDQNHVELEWTPPKSDGGRPLTGYVVQKKEKGSPYWVNAVHVPPKQTNVSPQLVALG